VISSISSLRLRLCGSLNRYSADLNRLQRFLDPLVVVILYWILCRKSLPLEATILLLVGLLTILLLGQGRLYESYRQESLWILLRRITTSWLLVLGSLLCWAFAVKISADLSRVSTFLWALTSWFFLCLMHVGVRKLLRFSRIQGVNSRSVIYVGLGDAAKSFYDYVQSAPYMGLYFAGWFSPDMSLADQLPVGMPQCTGGLADLRGWLSNHHPDIVFFSDTFSQDNSMADLVRDLGNSCIPSYFVPSWVFPGLGLRPAQFGSQSCIELWSSRSSLLDRQLKRFFDLFVAGSLLLIFSPILLLIALAIRLTSPGPVLFFQERYGLDGRRFRVCKFRSMYCTESGDRVGLRQAVRNDPRITPIGSFLRRSSLDELPQLLNVLMGQMSLVGPRPHAVDHNEFYRDQINGYMRRHMYKPGITGLAQVRGLRGETPALDLMAKRVEADLEYMYNWSLAGDVKILIMTLFSLGSSRAY
jgi:putative colanic acid biosynthesis UDP-glucose lipid carrier transferase